MGPTPERGRATRTQPSCASEGPFSSGHHRQVREATWMGAAGAHNNGAAHGASCGDRPAAVTRGRRPLAWQP